MSHFAKIDNGIVVDVIVAEQDFIDTLEDKDTWIQTSYNSRGNIHYNAETGEPDGLPALRANYAFIGGNYDIINDVFYDPQPFPSWSISAETNWVWQAPVPYPTDGKLYLWNEDNLAWERQKYAPTTTPTPIEVLP